jgi:hypothetical protein
MPRNRSDKCWSQHVTLRSFQQRFSFIHLERRHQLTQRRKIGNDVTR